MHRFRLALLASAALAASAAGATGLATCDSGPKAGWQPAAKLEQQLVARGWSVRRIKPHQRRRWLLRGLRAGRAGPARRGLLPPGDAGLGADPTAVIPAAPVRVWSAGLRAGHWALAASVLGCLWWYEGGSGHEGLGYAALALALWRVALGWRSRSPQVRFAGFVRAPAATWAYARAVTACREPRHLGHNPLGGWMIVALLATAVVAGASGALYATDRFWGDAVVHAVHSVAGWALALLLPLHLGGVALSSWRHRENLVAAMLGGHKLPPAPGDVDLG